MDDPLVYARAVHFAATILTAGTVLFGSLVAEPAFRTAPVALGLTIARFRRRSAWLLSTSLVAAVLSGAAWLTFLAAEILDVSATEVWRNGGVWTVIAQTRFGEITVARLVLAVLLALSSLPAASLTPARARFSAILAVGLLIGPAWIGHAGATPGAAGQFPLIADVFHLLAAGAWLGGLPPLAMLLVAALRAEKPGVSGVVTTAVHRFSLLGMASVALLLASGIVNSWYDIGSIGAVFGTTYGQLVLVKVALFTAMVSIAAVNRFRLTPRLAASNTMRQLRRNAWTETVLGLAAVLVVGVLGVMDPASHAGHQHADDHPAYGAVPADAAFVHIHSAQGMAEVTIMPGRVGAARATIRLLTDDDEPLAAHEVRITLTPPVAGNPPTTHLARQDPDGVWQVDGVKLPQPGNWTVKVTATLDHAKHLAAEAPIVIDPAR